MSGAETVGASFTAWKLVATAMFVLLNGFFVAAEFSLVRVRISEIETLAISDDDTIAGFLVARLGRIPRRSEIFEIGEYKVTVLAALRRRLVRLRFEKIQPEKTDPPPPAVEGSGRTTT